VAITELAETSALVGGGEVTSHSSSPHNLGGRRRGAQPRAVGRVFRGYAAQLITATNGREALALAERDRPDLILMDMRMPELNGYETIQLLKANDALKHIPVIAVTASSFERKRPGPGPSAKDSSASHLIGPS